VKLKYYHSFLKMTYYYDLQNKIKDEFAELIKHIQINSNFKSTYNICNYLIEIYKLGKKYVKLNDLKWYNRLIRIVDSFETLSQLVYHKKENNIDKIVGFIDFLKSKTKFIRSENIFNRIREIIFHFNQFITLNQKLANNLYNRLKKWSVFKNIISYFYCNNLLNSFSFIDKIEIIYCNVRKCRKSIREMDKENDIMPIKKRLRNIDNPYTLRNGLKYKPTIKRLTKDNVCNDVISYDCETYKGNCKLLVSSLGKNQNYYYPKNKNEKATFEGCIDFLLQYIDKKGVYRTFFNIDFDIQAILKLYHKSNRIEFVDKLSKGITLDYKYISTKTKREKHVKLTWLKSRLFEIRDVKRKRNVFFTDLYLFVKQSLNEASKKYLNERKIDDIDGNLLNNSKDYWNKRYDDILEYCYKDCKLTDNLTRLLCESIVDIGLKLPKYLVSYASISKQNFRHKDFLENIYYPNLKYTPIKIVQIAYDCYYGGRFEVLKRGYFKKLFLYDINSQYPTIIKELPDLENGNWIVKKLKKNELPKKKCIGYFKCQLNIPDNCRISTVLKKDGIVRYPNGFIWSTFTWFDLDLIREYIVSDIKAYIFEPNERNFKPFEKTVDWFYDSKAKFKVIKNSMKYTICKFGLNAFYGCNIERNVKIKLYKNREFKEYRAGILFNPIYASQITAFGRWSVIKDIPKNEQNHIIGIHTDSIISDIKLNKYLDIGKDLGQWNLEKKGKGLIINTGMYQIDNLCKSRGIPKKLIDNNWFLFAKKHRKEKEVKLVIKHMKKLREALVRDKSIEFVNTMSEIKRSVNINSDTKRHWIREFENFNDLLKNNIDSLPFISYDYRFELNPNPLIVSKQENISLVQTRFILKEQAINDY